MFGEGRCRWGRGGGGLQQVEEQVNKMATGKEGRGGGGSGGAPEKVELEQRKGTEEEGEEEEN